MLTAAAFQHTNRHVRHHLHRLGTRRPASTVPGARRPTVTTARASSSALVAEIVTGLAGIAERFATALNGVDTGLLADGVLNQSPTRVPARCHPGRRRRPAQTADARRTLGRARPRPAPHGFTVGNFAAKVPTITGTSDTNTPSAKRAYDLRKLRGNQLVDKPARTRRHRVPAPAARTIAALLTVRDQVIAPILAGIRSPRMGRKPKAGTRSTATTNSSAAYRQTPLDDPGAASRLRNPNPHAAHIDNEPSIGNPQGPGHIRQPMNEEVQIMGLREQGSAHHADHTDWILPDINDPTAGQVAISRELASEQVRMIADPAPLGLGAFGLTTFLLSLVNAGVMDKATEPVVLGVALAYGGVAQMLAGMWEFRKGNVFGATAFTSYGAFWLSFWAYVVFYAEEVPAQNHGQAAGWFLMAWAIFTILMLIAALRTTAVLAFLFAILAVVFFLLSFGALASNPGLTKVGGILGIATAAVAWYLCLAGVMASTFGRPILPNRPLFRASQGDKGG